MKTKMTPKEIFNAFLMILVFAIIVGVGIWIQYLSPSHNPPPNQETHYPEVQ